MPKPKIQMLDGQPLEIRILGDAVHALVRGRLTEELGERAYNEIAACAAAAGLRRVLYDHRLAMLALGPLAISRRIKIISADPMWQRARCAVVCTVRTNDYVFLESLARQHGLDLQVFTDGEQALRWLGQQMDS